MKAFVVFISFCLLTTSLFAQQETFDMVTYAAPSGWTKLGDGKDLTGYAVVNKELSGFHQSDNSRRTGGEYSNCEHHYYSEQKRIEKWSS